MSFTIIQSFVKFSQRSTTMHFQIAVNLLCTFSFVNYMLVFICIFATNHKYVLVRTSAFALLNLYEYSAYELLLFFVPHCKVSEVIVCSQCLCQFFCICHLSLLLRNLIVTYYFLLR